MSPPLGIWVAGYALAALATLILLLTPLFGPRGALKQFIQACRSCLTHPGGRALFALAAAILIADVIEASFDARLSAWHGIDLTPFVSRLEGDWVAGFQAATPNWTLPLLAWVYAPGFPALLAIAPIAWVGQQKGRAISEFALAVALNFALALPFYAFVPVREVAWSGLSDVVPQMEVLLPGITEFLRGGSALDNCFPSLHTSCTLTVAFVVARHGPKYLLCVSALGALLTVISTLSLGVHWLSDVVAALPFAVLCTVLGCKFAPRCARFERESSPERKPR